MKTVDFTQHLLSIQTELFRFAFKLTADREEANDLLQETSLKALDNEEKFTPDTNFKGWMYTIMRNIFINNYRKTVRDQTFVDQTDNLFHLNLPQDSGFDSTEGAYDLKEIHRIVNALPKDYRCLLDTSAYAHSHIVQGYICSARGRTVRVRIRDNTGYLTIKGASNDLSLIHI